MRLYCDLDGQERVAGQDVASNVQDAAMITRDEGSDLSILVRICRFVRLLDWLKVQKAPLDGDSNGMCTVVCIELLKYDLEIALDGVL